ncbi:cation:proton antiporter [Streptomyces graminifolii]|uniref:cation:proton antiporter n=1 Tax=Streptomyces TaxID=1883 RepID=UPI0036A1FE96
MSTLREHERLPRIRGARPWILYAALVVLPLALVPLLLHLGSDVLETPDATGTAPRSASLFDTVQRLLVTLSVILASCQLTGRLMRRLSQPTVIGEILAGILLGPSFLGLLWPAGYDWLLPQPLIEPLNALAQLGLVFFMFLVGQETDFRRIGRRGRNVLVISHVGVAVPLLAGIALAFLMYRSYAPEKIGFTEFALFFGVSMSITAFPVLARIVTHRGLNDTAVGTTALAGAAIGDVTAWCLLAVVVAVVERSSFTGVAVTVVLAAAFALVMRLAVRPALLRWSYGSRLDERGRPEGGSPDGAILPVLCCGILLCAFTTQWIGIHSIFGAFLLGAVMPRGSEKVERATVRMRGMTETLLLPLFFVYSGLRTDFGLFGANWRTWVWCLLLVTVAVVVKWGSTTIAALATGSVWQEALSLGALMNCRGLTELIVLNIGLDLGVISPALFTMFVFMAFVSTVMTSPALSLIELRRGRERPPRVAP